MGKMDKQELDSLLTKISSSAKQEQDGYDYAGYGKITDLKLTNEQLKSAVDIMWKICMEFDKDTRDKDYLFGGGLIKSKDVFLSQKEKDVKIPKEKEEKFREKLENIRPLVEFLIKLKEII